MKKVKWSGVHNPENFDSATDKLVLDWSGRLDRMERMLIYLCQKINPVVLGVDDISDILPPKRKK